MIRQIFDKYCDTVGMYCEKEPQNVLFFEDFEIAANEIADVLKSEIIEKLDAELMIIGGNQMSARFKELIRNTRL